MKKRPLLLLSLFVGAVVVSAAGIAAVVAIPLEAYCGLRPPEGVQTIEDFPGFIPEPHVIAVVHHEGEARIVLLGDQPLALMSERPAGYLFDATGQLLAWRVEADDVDDLSVWWEGAQAAIREGKTIGYPEALRVVEQARQSK
jgi:hypothetical protein